MFELAKAAAVLPLQFTRENGNFQKVVQLILRQISVMDQKICSQKVPVCLHWKSSCDHHVPPGMGNSSFTELTAVTGAGWGWSPSSWTVGIFERKSVLDAEGLLFAIGEWQGSCCTQWSWLIHNLFCEFSLCEEFCSLGDFLLCTGGRGFSCVIGRAYFCIFPL